MKTIKNRKIKKLNWKRLWEPEDDRLFGELLLIIAGVFIGNAISQSTKDITYLSGIWGVLIGFLVAYWAIKMIRRSERALNS